MLTLLELFSKKSVTEMKQTKVSLPISTVTSGIPLVDETPLLLVVNMSLLPAIA